MAKPSSGDPVERESSRLAGFVDLSGPMDLLRARPSELATSGARGADFAAAFIMHAAGETMSAGRRPPVPDVVNDPHGAWHGVLLADAMQKAGIAVTCRIGPEVGRDPAADNRAIVELLANRLLPKEARPPCWRHAPDWDTLR